MSIALKGAKPMWIALSGTKLDPHDLSMLLNFHQNAEWRAVEGFGRHLNILVSAMIALLAAGGACLVTGSTAVQLVAFIVPIFVVRLRRHAIESLDRYYQRFLEAVVCIAKIEYLMGLNQQVCAAGAAAALARQDVIYSKDPTLDVTRRWSNRPTDVESAEWVVEGLSGGHNKVAWCLFKDIWIGSCLLPLLGIFVFPASGGAFAIGDISPMCLKLCLALILAWLSIAGSRFLYNRDSQMIKEGRRSKPRESDSSAVDPQG